MGIQAPSHRGFLTVIAWGVLAALPAGAQGKPNILVIFGDDIGQTLRRSLLP